MAPASSNGRRNSREALQSVQRGRGVAVPGRELQGAPEVHGRQGVVVPAQGDVPQPAEDGRRPLAQVLDAPGDDPAQIGPCVLQLPPGGEQLGLVVQRHRVVRAQAERDPVAGLRLRLQAVGLADAAPGQEVEDVVRVERAGPAVAGRAPGPTRLAARAVAPSGSAGRPGRGRRNAPDQPDSLRPSLRVYTARTSSHPVAPGDARGARQGGTARGVWPTVDRRGHRQPGLAARSAGPGARDHRRPAAHHHRGRALHGRRRSDEPGVLPPPGAASVLPKTSQPAPGEFLEAFRAVASPGGRPSSRCTPRASSAARCVPPRRPPACCGKSARTTESR